KIVSIYYQCKTAVINYSNIPSNNTSIASDESGISPPFTSTYLQMVSLTFTNAWQESSFWTRMEGFMEEKNFIGKIQVQNRIIVDQKEKKEAILQK
ncbi:hypothetical protein ACJX0J_027289, partial [Zea mays]